MNKKYYANKLIELFPEFHEIYQIHLNNYGELLGHVFFGEINPILFRLLQTNEDKHSIYKYIKLIEDMYRDGDEDVKNIVEFTILEYLGDDETVLRNAFSYFSENLMWASKEVEADWERREIELCYKNGKILYDW